MSRQIELERERIALELEEEKKTQAEWEKRVKEQAKKIENLSSMVLFSNRDETREHIKKVLLAIYIQVYFLECVDSFFLSSLNIKANLAMFGICPTNKTLNAVLYRDQ